MAVEHRCWRFDIDAAVTAFDGLASLDDVLGREIGDRVAKIRTEGARGEQLRMLRLDPRDEESWAAFLRPEATDFGYEQAGAARVMLLLAAICREAKGIRHGVGGLDQSLVVAGWPRQRIARTLRGDHLASFFERHVPALKDAAWRCRHWLAGGWLDARSAAGLKASLVRDLPAISRAIPASAAQWSETSGRDAQWHEERLRLALDDLDAMLAQPVDGQAIWIVQD